MDIVIGGPSLVYSSLVQKANFVLRLSIVLVLKPTKLPEKAVYQIFLYTTLYLSVAYY